MPEEREKMAPSPSTPHRKLQPEYKHRSKLFDAMLEVLDWPVTVRFEGRVAVVRERDGASVREMTGDEALVYVSELYEKATGQKAPVWNPKKVTGRESKR